MKTSTTASLALLGVCLALHTGCAGSPVEIQGRTGDELAKTTDFELCEAYGASLQMFGGSKNMRAEIERRGVFTADQWARIDAADIRLGDSPSLVIAALGTPDKSRVQTRTDGTTLVWLYEPKGIYARVYGWFVFHDGKLYSIEK